MTLRVIARMNLTASPLQPAFPLPDVLIYRTSAETVCRKAIIGPNTDVVLSSTLSAAGANPRFFPNAIMHDKFYLVTNGAPNSGGYINCVDINTGTTTKQNTELAASFVDQGMIGKIRRVSGSVVSYQAVCVSVSLAKGVQYWVNIPISGGLGESFETLNGTTCFMFGFTNYHDTAGILARMAQGNPLQLLNFINTTGRRSPTSLNLPTTFGGLAIAYQDFITNYRRVPWGSWETDTHAYNFWIQNPPTGKPGVNKWNKKTNEVQSMILDDFTVFDRSFYSAANLEPKSRRLYWGFSIYESRLFASMGSWPLQLNNYIDLDANFTGAINGIGIIPPYVYVTKVAGGTYPAQFIKILDTDLVPENIYLGTKPKIRVRR